jgi:hypothetical protein
MVWIKSRSTSYYHRVFDQIRGAQQEIYTNATDAEVTATGGSNSFTSTGFNVASDYANTSGQTFIAWMWDAGSSTVSNTQGSISSQVRANPSAGFSIVTYTGNGTSGATIGHGGLVNLDKGFIVIKSRSIVETWRVGHGSLGWTQYMSLSSTGGAGTASTIWNNTAPTSTVVTLGTDTSINQNGATYVAYCFAPVSGYSSFGSYVGNGSSDGPMVFCNFRPRWVMIKNASSTGSWPIIDTARSIDNAAEEYVYANLSVAEANDAGALIDVLSNGFKLKNTYANFNASSNTYIYAAFAEFPMALNARAR